MYFRKLAGTVLALTMTTATVHAADKDGNYAVWGMGNSSCNAYNNDRAEGKTDPYKYYVMGYLTAYNVHQQETYSISGAQPMPDIMSWFDDFCTNNAIHSFESALVNYISENYPDRLKRPPSPFQR